MKKTQLSWEKLYRLALAFVATKPQKDHHKLSKLLIEFLAFGTKEHK